MSSKRSRVATGAVWVATTAALAAIGSVIAGAVEARTADTLAEAIATIGFGTIITWPILTLVALLARALWLGWNPRGLAAGMVDEHGSAPRLAGWLAYVLVACFLLSWATFNVIRLLAAWTTFKPTVVAITVPPLVVVTALGLVAGSRPVVGAFAAAAGWLDRKCRAKWKRSPFKPRALAIAAAVALATVAVLAWEISIKPRIGYLDLAILLHPAIAIAVTSAAGVAARKVPVRARRIGLAAGAAVAVLTMGFAQWMRTYEPLAVLQIWARPTIASEAVEHIYELEDLRDDIAVMVDPPRLRSGATPRNIVLITIDTVRADHTPLNGGHADMPNLARLGSTGAVFYEAFSPGNVTRRSVPSIALGVSPPRVRGKVAGWALRLDPRHVLLAERFRAAGYDTAGFFCCASFWGAYHKLGLNRGLDHVEIEPDGAKLSELAREWLTARRADPSATKPLFIWVHFIEPHNWLEGHNPQTSSDRSAQYDRVLNEVDGYVGIVLSAFQEAGAQAPIVAITADHGEALGDHGSPYHSTDLYDSQIHVPLVINGPGIPAHRVLEVVGVVGIAPTLLELAGFSPPGMPQVDGTSFAALATGTGSGDPDGGYAFAAMIKDRSVPDGMRAVMRGRWKLIETKHGFELYDRASDPRESHNLATTRTDMLAQMKTLLDGRRAIDSHSPFASR